MSTSRIYTAKGKILSISPTKVISDKFQKASMVLDQSEPEDKFKDYLEIEFVNGDVGILRGYCPGQEVEVHFKVASRASSKYPGQYFTSARGKEIALDAAYRKTNDAAEIPMKTAPGAAAVETATGEDDMPF